MTHSCFVCSTGNPDRIAKGTTIEFSERFVGPPARAHGGIAVGALTCPVLQLADANGMKTPVVDYVSGRLHAPVPLATTLVAHASSSEDGFSVAMQNADAVVVSGVVSVKEGNLTPGSIIQEPPKELSTELERMSTLADADLEGPTLIEQYYQYCANAGVEDDIDCFGCSEKPHALKLHNRVTADGDLWTRWIIEPEQIDSPGRLAASVVTAALDCSNLWVLQARESQLSLQMLMHDKKVWITGTHAVHFLRVPTTEGDYRVVTRFLRQEGRKGFTMVALLDRHGTAYAVAEAISILIDVPAEMEL